MLPSRPACTRPTRWSSRRSERTGRPPEWCSSRGSTAEASCSSPTIEAESRVELDAEPACALLFPWHPLERQVRIEGVASRVDAEESDAYFRTRPRVAQLGAWSSPQSEVVESRDYLEQRFLHEQDRFSDRIEIPRPEQWGGIRVRPHRIEFWQGRPGRLHDRVRFDRVDESRWAVERLAP